MAILVVGFACASTRATPQEAKIKHVVVLMLENRPFDHVFGWRPGVDGVNGSEYNHVNASDPHSPKVFYTANAPYINDCDPNHNTPPTTYKIFGPKAEKDKNFTHPTMSGFVDFENNYDGGTTSLEYCNVMQSFAPSRLPIINALADEFVLFDRFFCAVPGPTWPNRLFFMSGTSAGLTETFPWYHNVIGKLFPQKTIFDQVSEAGGKWKVYYNDTPWELFVESLAHHTEHMHSLGQFFEDCATGDLPDFAYINPRSGINITEGVGSNDEHPDHDMAVGERYIKDIYEAIRASPAWNETLFVLTYDEHGGFYDHVPPPMGAPPPGDGEASYPDLDFKFDRLGLRIPTLLISPWVSKGKVEHAPPASQKPSENSEYDLTSIMATARKLLPVLHRTSPLTKRDAWAATFEHLFDQSSPRTDCPMHLPTPPPPTMGLREEAAKPLNSLQQHIVTVHAYLAGDPFPGHITSQGYVGEYVKSRFARHANQTAMWKRSKSTAPLHFNVIVQPVFATNYEAELWNVSVDPGTPFNTFSVKIEGAEYCLDTTPKPANGTFPVVTLCYPSKHPSRNRDKDQHWILEKDATIRPFHSPNLCLTNDYFRGGKYVFLEYCVVGKVEQHWAWHGIAPGDPGEFTIFFSGWAPFAIQVDKPFL